MKNIVRYQNGNYTVMLDLKTGTKIRKTNDNYFRAEFPESMDIKICERCNANCDFCYEGSALDGRLGDIMSESFIDKLRPYTEIAIGGGNPLEHPSLVPFLKKLKSLKLIPSMTVNQKHFMENTSFIKVLIDEQLIYGLGVSLVNPDEKFIEEVQSIPNAVIHVVVGIIPIDTLKMIMNKNLKVLMLGYKQLKRGKQLYEQNRTQITRKIYSLYEFLPTIVEENWFKVLSFDNLAIKQLEPSRVMSKKQWQEFYMGDDGTATMYVDMVNREYAVSSLSTVRYALSDNIDDMFANIRTN